MPVTLSERMESRGFVYALRSEQRFTYIATGSDDDQDILSHCQANIPADYEGLVLASIRADPINVDETGGTGTWNVEAVYATPEFVPFDYNDSSESFDTSGGTQHITQSLATVAAFAASGSPPDHGGAIGVSDDKVEGVDITVPVYRFEETHPFSPAVVNNAFKGVIFGLTGKVNDASFKGFAAGEVLFLGAQGPVRSIA
jgi:hypothetical protein